MHTSSLAHSHAAMHGLSAYAVDVKLVDGEAIHTPPHFILPAAAASTDVLLPASVSLGFASRAARVVDCTGLRPPPASGSSRRAARNLSSDQCSIGNDSRAGHASGSGCGGGVGRRVISPPRAGGEYRHNGSDGAPRYSPLLLVLVPSRMQLSLTSSQPVELRVGYQDGILGLAVARCLLLVPQPADLDDDAGPAAAATEVAVSAAASSRATKQAGAADGSAAGHAGVYKVGALTASVAGAPVTDTTIAPSSPAVPLAEPAPPTALPDAVSAVDDLFAPTLAAPVLPLLDSLVVNPSVVAMTITLALPSASVVLMNDVGRLDTPLLVSGKGCGNVSPYQLFSLNVYERALTIKLCQL